MTSTNGARVWYKGFYFVSSPRWFTVWKGLPGRGKPIAGPLPLSRPITSESDLFVAADEWLVTR